MFTIEVVDLYPEEESIISSSYKQSKPVKIIEETKNIDSLWDDIIDLKDQNFGRRFFNYVPHNIIVVFNENNKLVGYCGLNLINGLHIESLCVDQDFRYNGIGKSILEKAYEIGQELNKNPKWVDHIEYEGDIINKKDPITINDSQSSTAKLDPNYLTLEVNNDYNFSGLLIFYEKCGYERIPMKGYSTAYFKKLIK